MREGNLPHFNPDLDDENAPDSVYDFRKELKESDRVLICIPEYANGVPVVLKNALDWVVSSGEFMYKPTAVISASPSQFGGDKAHDSLILTLSIITAKIVDSGTVKIPFVTKKVKPQGELTDPARLNVEDINWENGSAVVNGKGSKQREVYFTTECKVWLKKYLDTREDNCEALFVTHRNPVRRMTIPTLRLAVKLIAARGQVHVNVYPHRFRHTYACQLLDNGAPLDFIQGMLGHEKASI